MYYILQNSDSFFVVDPMMTKFGEFATYEEAEDFCQYLNENMPFSQKTNNQSAQVRFESNQNYNNEVPQPMITRPSYTTVPQMSFQQPYAPMMQMPQPMMQMPQPMMHSGPGVSYGNITINCNGTGQPEPTRQISTSDNQYLHTNIETKPEQTYEQKPAPVRKEAVLVQDQVKRKEATNTSETAEQKAKRISDMELQKILSEEMDDNPISTEAAKISNAAAKSKVNYLKDESLTSFGGSDTAQSQRNSSSAQFSSQTDDSERNNYDDDDDLSKTWVSTKELYNFIQKLEP